MTQNKDVEGYFEKFARALARYHGQAKKIKEDEPAIGECNADHPPRVSWLYEFSTEIDSVRRNDWIPTCRLNIEKQKFQVTFERDLVFLGEPYDIWMVEGGILTVLINDSMLFREQYRHFPFGDGPFNEIKIERNMEGPSLSFGLEELLEEAFTKTRHDGVCGCFNYIAYGKW